MPETAEPGEHTITLEGGAQASILVEEVSLDEIKERLGYALLPEYVPNGLKLSAANVTGSRGHLMFDGPEGRAQRILSRSLFRGGLPSGGRPKFGKAP